MARTTEELAKSVSEMCYGDLPAPAVHRAKQVLVDCMGCALGANVVDRSRVALELVSELGGNPLATVIGGPRTSYTLASFANGELINALDFDPLGPLMGHVVPFVVPPVLAMAERTRAPGRELITALVIGLEVGGRVASALPGNRKLLPEPPYYEPNPGFTYGVAIFGAVAGAGKLLGLNPEQLAHSFGIAGTTMPAPSLQKWEHTAGPARMMKYGSSTGIVAELATTAALLAEKGFTADTAFFDGDWSLQKILGVPHFEPRRIVLDLGKSWHMDAISFKAFPCCGGNHTAIQALLRALSESGVDPNDIEEIVVMGDAWMFTPNRCQETVESYADAQFSSAYLAAVVPFYGTTPSPAWQMPEVYKDPRVLAMMRKVKMVVDTSAAEHSGRTKTGGWSVNRSVVVEIQAKGKRYTAEERTARGSPDDPLSDDDIRAKFLANAAYSRLVPRKAQQAMDVAYRLEDVSDITELMALLRAEEASTTVG